MLLRRFKSKIQFSLLLAAALIFAALLCALISQADFSDDEDASVSLTESVSGQDSEDQAFEACMEDLFRQEVSASGLTLHYTLEDPSAYGITQYSTDLGVYSADQPRIAAALAENILSTLKDFHPENLSVSNRLTLDQLKYSLQQTADGASFAYYSEPLRPTTGEQAQLPILLAEYTFSDAQDIQDYLEILSSIPAYFDSICAYEQEKQAHGLFMADSAARTVIAQCRDFAASPEDHYLLHTFEEKIGSLKGLSKNEKEACNKQNRAILTEDVLPAYRELADCLASLCSSADSSPEAGSSGSTPAAHTASPGDPGGLCRLPRGAEYYEYLIHLCTGSDDSIETLQKRTEEKRTADLTRASSLIADDPGLQEQLQNPEEASAKILSASPEEMLQHLQQAIREDFPQIRECHYTVKYVDPAMEDYLAPAFYLTAPLDHVTENSIYINRGSGYSGLQLFTTLAHEGYPGHLYQNAVSATSGLLPIRALLGTAGYTEGWATYVEMLSYYYAGLPETLAEALSLEQSAILSLYATADLGIHADGWSLQQTADFFSDYGFSDEETIRGIYELILAEPAHYLKYYIGYLEFLSLKETAKEKMGKAYSDLNFHRTVLEMGSAAFPVLETYLTEFWK